MMGSLALSTMLMTTACKGSQQPQSVSETDTTEVSK